MSDAASSSYRVEPLDPEHDRSGFSSGVEVLDRYLRKQASQDVRRRIASCFVLIAGDGSLAGYYTLSATSVALADLPPAVAKKLPRYPAVPATLLGRLAVDRAHRGHGLGKLLLLDAFSRTLRSEIASYALIVEAKNDRARTFYERYGVTRLPDAGRRLFLPMAQVAALFA